MKDLLVTFGDEVKVTSGGKVSGYLIRFGGTDLDGDFFTPSCDFGRPTKVGDSFKMNLYYAHGMDEVMGKEAIGTGRVVVKDAGLWYEGQVEINDEYRKMIAKLGQEGRLGFSSGAASHLVERKSVGAASQILRWNLAEASLTPKPAEPRNMASVKSLQSLIQTDAKCGGDMMPSSSSQPQVVLIRPKPYTYAFPVRAEVQGMTTMRNNAPKPEEELMRRYMVPRQDAMQGYMPVLPNTTAYPAVQGYMPVLSPSTQYPAMQSMDEPFAPQGYMQTVPMVGYGRTPANSGGSCTKCGYPITKDMGFCPSCGTAQAVQAMGMQMQPMVQPQFVSCKACGRGVMKGMAYCPHCGTPQMMSKDDGMMPGMMPMGEGEGDKPDVHVTPQTLSSILNSLMQAYYEMVQALSEGEEESAYDSYHGKLMKEWDMLHAAGKSFLSERVRPLSEVQSIPMVFTKSKPLTVGEFERRVRDAFGLSRKEAKTVASHGWKALCDAGVAAMTDEVESESKAIIWEDAPQVEEPVVQDAPVSEEPVKKPRKKVATPVAEPVAEVVAQPEVEEAKSVSELDNADDDDDSDASDDDGESTEVVAAELSDEAKAVNEAKRETLMRQLMLQQLASQEG